MTWNATAARRAIQDAGGLVKVAETSGLDLATVKRLRHAQKHGPSFDTAAKFAAATGHSLDDFRRRP